MIYTEFNSAFGITLAAAENGKLRNLWFPGQKHEPDYSCWTKDDNDPVFRQLQSELNEYARKQRTVFNIPMEAKGTEFQQAVWQALQAIPFGSHSSYGEMAHLLDRPKASRAVGAAVGKNPISILIPCHRVLGKRGSLTGFASGLEMKTRLLSIEGIV